MTYFHNPFLFVSTIYFICFQAVAYSSHPAVVLLDVMYTLRTPLSLLLWSLLLPWFYCSVAHYQVLPYCLAHHCVLDQLLPSLYILPYIVRYRSLLYLCFPTARKTLSILGPLFLELLLFSFDNGGGGGVQTPSDAFTTENSRQHLPKLTTSFGVPPLAGDKLGFKSHP